MYTGGSGGISGLLAQYQFGQQQSSLLSAYGNYQPEPVEVSLAQKKTAAEQAIASYQQSLDDINAAIDAINEHPNVAKVINLLRKVGL